MAMPIMHRFVKVAVFSAIVAASIAGCSRSKKTTQNLDRATQERIAAAKYCRIVQVPPAYAPKEIELMKLSGDRQWDQQIIVCTSLLRDESIRRFPDYRANIYLHLADAFLAKSKGKDIGSYLMLCRWLSNKLSRPS
jgi:predicted NACHT family NTPase